MVVGIPVDPRVPVGSTGGQLHAPCQAISSVVELRGEGICMYVSAGGIYVCVGQMYVPPTPLPTKTNNLDFPKIFFLPKW